MNKIPKNDKENIYYNMTEYINEENTMKYSMYGTHFSKEMMSSS